MSMYSENEFNIYPTIVQHQLNIKNNNRIKLSRLAVIDISGRVHLSLADNLNSESLILDLDYLEDGLYFILLESENRRVNITRIIKN